MEVTLPKTTDLIATNVPEASFSDWSPITTYAASDRRYVLYSDFTELMSYGDCTFDQFSKDGAEWTYDGTNSEYDCDGAQAGVSKLYQETDSVTTGDLYLTQYEVKNYSAGEIKSYVYGGLGTARTANGTYQEVVTAGSTDTKIGVQGSSTFVGSITNLSFKRIGKYTSKDIYESQVGSNTNNFPPDDDGTNWVKVSASNRWKMFDDYMSSQAQNPAKISVKIKSNKCNKLAYFLTEATNVEYIVSDDSVTETSTTSITPSASVIALTTTHANSWAIGDKVEVYRTSDPRTFFAGTLTDWTQSTGVAEVTATVFDVGTGGAQTDWTMALVYDHESESLYQEEVLSWSDYFFTPIRFSSSAAHSFTMSYNTSCRVIFTGNTNDTIKVGHLLVGLSNYLGKTQYGLRGSISDFSTKDANAFGEYALVKRAYAKELVYTVTIDSTAVDSVFQILTQLRATPCVWDANGSSTNVSMAIAFGFYSDFEVKSEYKNLSECDLGIQGLT